MLDRVTCLLGTPCLLARGTLLDGLSFCHVNGSCRIHPASRGEKTAKIWRREITILGNCFVFQHLPVISAEQNDSKSEEINAIGG